MNVERTDASETDLMAVALQRALTEQKTALFLSTNIDRMYEAMAECEEVATGLLNSNMSVAVQWAHRAVTAENKDISGSPVVCVALFGHLRQPVDFMKYYKCSINILISQTDPYDDEDLFKWMHFGSLCHTMQSAMGAAYNDLEARTRDAVRKVAIERAMAQKEGRRLI